VSDLNVYMNILESKKGGFIATGKNVAIEV
jgi:hypothetical protein